MERELVLKYNHSTTCFVWLFKSYFWFSFLVNVVFVIPGVDVTFSSKFIWTFTAFFTAFCLQKKCTLFLNMDFIFAMWATLSTALDFDVQSTRLSLVSVVSWSFVIFCFAFGNVIHFTQSLFCARIKWSFFSLSEVSWI